MVWAKLRYKDGMGNECMSFLFRFNDHGIELLGRF